MNSTKVPDTRQVATITTTCDFYFDSKNEAKAIANVFVTDQQQLQPQQQNNHNFNWVETK